MAIIHHPSLAQYSLFYLTPLSFRLIKTDKNLLITFVDNEKGFITATLKGNFSWNILSTVCCKIDSKHEVLFDIEQKSQQKNLASSSHRKMNFFSPRLRVPGLGVMRHS